MDVPSNFEKVLKLRVHSLFGVPPTYHIGSNICESITTLIYSLKGEIVSKKLSTANAANQTNTNDNTTATNTAEGTVVPSEKEKKSIIARAKELFTAVIKNQKATLKDRLELAKFLLEKKKELKNDFYKVITDDVISRKQVGRHIQLILTLGAIDDYTQGMSTKNKVASKIEENLSLLVEDTRVTSITEKDIETMPEPTMVAIAIAKHTDTKDDFMKAIKGEEKILDTIKKEKSEASKALKKTADDEAKEVLAKLKPENMETEKYESLLSQEKPAIIAMLQAQIDDSKAQLDELTDLRVIVKNAKLYDGDKSKSEADIKTEEG